MGWGGRYDHCIFAIACFGPTKKENFIVVMLTSKEGSVRVVWFAKVVVLL